MREKERGNRRGEEKEERYKDKGKGDIGIEGESRRKKGNRRREEKEERER
jgi:hypothetical protein